MLCYGELCPGYFIAMFFYLGCDDDTEAGSLFSTARFIAYILLLKFAPGSYIVATLHYLRYQAKKLRLKKRKKVYMLVRSPCSTSAERAYAHKAHGLVNYCSLPNKVSNPTSQSPGTWGSGLSRHLLVHSVLDKA